METDIESLAITLSAIMQGRSLGTAESLTGGQIGSVITSIPGASSFYKGGVIAYSSELKHSLLHVPTEVLSSFGAVSEETAQAMAVNVATELGAEFGLAVTGVAGPGVQEGKPAGTVFVACHRAESDFGPAETQVEELRLSPLSLTPIERRAEIRDETVAAALELLLSMV